MMCDVVSSLPEHWLLGSADNVPVKPTSFALKKQGPEIKTGEKAIRFPLGSRTDP